jgi:hypothetical protein
MASGRLGVGIPTANTDTLVYTVPSNCQFAKLTINVLNANTSETASINLAIALTDYTQDNEYIEKGLSIPAKGILNITDIVCSRGERIIIKSSLSDTVIRVSGEEITKPS